MKNFRTVMTVAALAATLFLAGTPARADEGKCCSSEKQTSQKSCCSGEKAQKSGWFVNGQAPASACSDGKSCCKGEANKDSCCKDSQSKDSGCCKSK